MEIQCIQTMYISHAGDEIVRDYRGEINEVVHEEVTNCRDTVAQQMWDSYQQVLLDRAGDDELVDELMEGDHEDVSDDDDEDLIRTYVDCWSLVYRNIVQHIMTIYDLTKKQATKKNATKTNATYIYSQVLHQIISNIHGFLCSLKLSHLMTEGPKLHMYP